MMFQKELYWKRRQKLHELLNGGVVLFPANEESSMNYPANTYHYHQDSTFLYFFGHNQPGLAGVCDLDEGKDILFGDDLEIDDIIWMGDHPTMNELAAKIGVENTKSYSELAAYLKKAISEGRKVHLLPPYRGDMKIALSQLLSCSVEELSSFVSQELIDAVVSLREVKDEFEIAEIEKAVDVAYLMHTTAMKMAFPGNFEYELAGAIEGISLAHGGPVSFPIILSMDGQTLHNHSHHQELTEGRMIVTDAGATTALGYTSDITRTCPVGGKFSSRQKDIYEIVLAANMGAIEGARPGVRNLDLHLDAARTIAAGLKDLGLLKGSVEDIVAAGAHALFFPHGLGHQMGMDVHDMENLGENNVGYTKELKRSEQFGLAYLRMGKEHKPGFVFTVEPGCYFIPHLIEIWKGEGKHKEFINYDKAQEYLDVNFGGVRIEDDILITEDGCKVLGTPIPKSVAEVEETMNS